MISMATWLADAANAALNALPADQADSVREAIRSIPAERGERVDFPGVTPPAPFHAKEPTDPAAPVVIYRATVPGERGEPGDLVVVGLMDHDVYRAARRAQRGLIGESPTVRDAVNSVVAGTVSTFARGGR